MFNKLKVLELASVLAGPSVGQFFAELGAEVIKVENAGAGGDVTRSWRAPGEKTDDRSAYFCSANWGKKSIALDLAAPEGKRILLQLVGRADIIIVSFKPGDAEKLGVAYGDLSHDNPRLIYGQITGYGEQDSRVGYDAVIQAESGFMSMNGETGGLPMKMPVALIDLLAAHQLKEGLLIALINRMQNGRGQRVEVSLIDSAIASLANQGSNWLVGKMLPQRQGSLHPNIAPYGESFTTSDGKTLLLAVGNDRQFISLLKILGLDALSEDPRFSTNEHRVKNRRLLHATLVESIEEFDSDVLMKMLNESNVPAGMVNDLRHVFEGESAKSVMIGNSQMSGTRTFVSRFNGAWSTAGSLLPPPHFGEHNKEILSEFREGPLSP